MLRMSKCPYCKVDLHIEDFFVVLEKETKKGKLKTKVKGFKGGSIDKGWSGFKMWACPGCDTILGFSEYEYSRAT